MQGWDFEVEKGDKKAGQSNVKMNGANTSLVMANNGYV